MVPESYKNKEGQGMDTNTQLILSSITALKTDMDAKLKSIDDNMAQIKSHSDAHAIQIGRLEERYNARIEELDRNKQKLWVEVDILRARQSELTTALEVHSTGENRASEATEKAVEKGFNWANLLTPAILTIGLAIIGYMVAAK